MRPTPAFERSGAANKSCSPPLQSTADICIVVVDCVVTVVVFVVDVLVVVVDVLVQNLSDLCLQTRNWGQTEDHILFFLKKLGGNWVHTISRCAVLIEMFQDP